MTRFLVQSPHEPINNSEISSLVFRHRLEGSDSRRKRMLLKINDLPYMTFVNIKSIESTTYAFYAASNATSFELTY